MSTALLWAQARPWMTTHRSALLLAVVIGFVLIWPAPHIPSLRSPNELVRLLSTRAMVDDGSLSIDAQEKRFGQLTDRALRDGRAYSDKAPGLSLLAVPIYAALRVVVDAPDISNAQLLRLMRTLLIVLPTIFWIFLLGQWLERLRLEKDLVVTVQVALALGTPGFAYCLNFVGHQAAAWMLGSALALSWLGRKGSLRARAAAGFLAGLAAITEYPALTMVPVIALLAFVGTPQRWRGLFWFTVAAAVPLLAGSLYHYAAFGGPLTTGYSFLANPTFRAVHQVGVLGVGLPDPEALVAVTLGTHRGLLPLAPWLLFGLAGLLALRHPHHRPLVVALVANILLALWVATGFGYWVGGWSVGPRHLVSALPAMAVLAALGAEALDRWRRSWAWAALLGSLVLAGGVASGAAALTYPGFPEELADPLFELSLPLLARLQFSYSLGTSLGLRSDVAMLPALAVACGLVAWVAGGAPPWRELARARTLWRFGLAAWTTLAFFGLLFVARDEPSRVARFRVAWLTQTRWQPADVPRPYEPRLERWEPNQRAIQRRARVRPEFFRAFGAMEAYRGNDPDALVNYARAAWGAARIDAPPESGAAAVPVPAPAESRPDGGAFLGPAKKRDRGPIGSPNRRIVPHRQNRRTVPE